MLQDQIPLLRILERKQATKSSCCQAWVAEAVGLSLANIKHESILTLTASASRRRLVGKMLEAFQQPRNRYNSFQCISCPSQKVPRVCITCLRIAAPTSVHYRGLRKSGCILIRERQCADVLMVSAPLHQWATRQHAGALLHDCMIA